MTIIIIVNFCCVKDKVQNDSHNLFKLCLLFLIHTDKVWEMHNLFLEETQVSFTEVRNQFSLKLEIKSSLGRRLFL